MRKLGAVVAAVTLTAVLCVGTNVAGAARARGSNVKVLDQHAGVARKKAPTRFVAVKKAVPVASGDAVQTDAVGFAEVHYPDGSLTRVDVNTTFVVELASKTTTKAKLTSGQVWNEVKAATGSQPHFEVATPNATAAVRGTAFAIRCDQQQACTFGVVDGTVEIDTAGDSVAITAGQQVGVDGTGQLGEPEPLVVGQWIKQNQYQDIGGGQTAPGITGAVAGLTASPTTPANIAAAISAERAAKIAAGNFVGAPYASVTCDGTKALKAGDVTHCVAKGPTGTSITYRVVVLDASGKFGLSRRQSIMDTRAIGAYLVSIPEDDGGLLVSADCGQPQYIVVDLPSGTFVTCALVDEQGRTGDQPIYADADGALRSPPATLSSSAEPGQPAPEGDQPVEPSPDAGSDPGTDTDAGSGSGGVPVDNGGGAISLA